MRKVEIPFQRERDGETRSGDDEFDANLLLVLKLMRTTIFHPLGILFSF